MIASYLTQIIWKLTEDIEESQHSNIHYALLSRPWLFESPSSTASSLVNKFSSFFVAKFCFVASLCCWFNGCLFVVQDGQADL